LKEKTVTVTSYFYKVTFPTLHLALYNIATIAHKIRNASKWRAP